jgi:hypothetical protein
MKPVRAGCAVFVAVCMSVLVIGSLPKSQADQVHDNEVFPNPLLLHTQNHNGPRDSLQAIVQDAAAEGGSVVRCLNEHCTDLATNEDMGYAQDGYYITFPKDTGYQDKIDRYQTRIRNWLEGQ